MARNVAASLKRYSSSYFNGPKQWPTKSFDVWLLLWLLVYRMKPRRIVEFGGGRSTNLLGEYAYKNAVDLFCIEQDRAFRNVIRRGLGIANLPRDFVIHAPISGEWFDLKFLAEHLPEKADFILVDAPGGAKNTGRRDSAVGIAYIASLASEDAVIVYDDTHRDVVARALEETLSETGRDYCVAKVAYPLKGMDQVNEISFCVPMKFQSTLMECLKILHPNVTYSIFASSINEGLRPAS